MSPLFRPESIEAQRRKLFGSVNLWQPVPMAAFTAVAVIGVLAGAVYLATGTYARKETVQGWIVPEAGLSEVYAQRGGVVASLAVTQGQDVQAGDPIATISLDMAGPDGSVVPIQRAQVRARLAELQIQESAAAQRFSEEAARLSGRASTTLDRFAADDARLAEAARGAATRFASDDARLEDRARAARDDAARLQTNRALAADALALAERAQSQAETLESRGFMSAGETDRRRQAVLSARAQLTDIDRQIEARRQEAADFESQRQSLRAAYDAETRDITRQRASLSAARSGEITDIARQRATLAPAARSETSQIRSARSQLESGLTELSVQDGYVVRAPVSGRIASLNLRVGEAASQQAPVATIAPAGSALEAQLLVPTRAVGFVTSGQEVRLMVDAFPYQRFGTIRGEVREISGSTLTPAEARAPFELRETVYRLRVRVPAAHVDAYGVRRVLQPGMTLKADIIADRRTFLQWLLDPLLAARARTAA
ncbi:HlyD family efflux transporter periplasmic adaptor subunit [Novosphingobium sp.]|uniref:HlyD family efflux transporter periplasmic adaptor subunit n=1 Tax=Novosphingobium sp. TaxID=1874826 RepID=UPI002630373D|nr:HlyD family efflux transporter periplasmic adaptor subunit [Novosphingobium sp.]